LTLIKDKIFYGVKILHERKLLVYTLYIKRGNIFELWRPLKEVMSMNNSDLQQLRAIVQYEHDRTCCVCRNKNHKHLQIHHIDGNHDNNTKENLSVLCLDCHTDTQLKGGFTLKLTPQVVSKYHDEWIDSVANKRDLNPFEKFRLFKKVPDNDNIYTKQFKQNKIIPINAIFYFKDYYYRTDYFPSIIVSSNEINDKNGSIYGSILKAFLLCSLGNISSDFTLAPISKDITNCRRFVTVEKHKIAIPNFMFNKHKSVLPLHIIRRHIPDSNELELFLVPLAVNKNINYNFLRDAFDNIRDELIGKYLAL
jgi:hypothetical protein